MLHCLGSGHEFIRDRFEVSVRIIQTEDKAAGSDPAQRQSFGAQIILQHPVVTRWPRVDDTPNRGHVRHLHRQALVAQAPVELLCPIVPHRIEIAVQSANFRAFDPLEERAHSAHDVGMGVEGPAGKTDVGGAIVAVALHQILAAADHADRKASSESLPIGDNVGLECRNTLAPRQVRGGSRRKPHRRSARSYARCRQHAGASANQCRLLCQNSCVWHYRPARNPKTRRHSDAAPAAD